MSSLSELTGKALDVSGAFTGYTAPEESHRRVTEKWRGYAEEAGVTLNAFQPVKAKKQDDGRWAVAWMVGERDDMYLLLLDMESGTAGVEYYMKAQRIQDHP